MPSVDVVGRNCAGQAGPVYTVFAVWRYSEEEGLYLVKRLTLICTLVLICGWTVTASAQDTVKPPVIESISVTVEKDKPEQLVFKLSEEHTPKIFQLDSDKPRLVFDFFNVGYVSKIEQISDVGGRIIAGVRVGKHKGPAKTRVVVDIQKNSPYRYRQTFSDVDNSLVVTFDAAPSKVVSTAAQPTRISVEHPKRVHSPAQPEIRVETVVKKENKQEPVKAEDSDGTHKVAVIAADSTKKVVKPATLKFDKTEGADGPAKSEERQDLQKESQTAVVTQADDKKSPKTEVVADTPAAEIDPVLLDISFEKSINNSETVLFRLNQFYPPLVFGVEKGEPRVVCDFIDARIDEKVPDTIEAGGQFVNRISVSKDSDPAKVRVELILVPNRHYDLQQLFFKEDNLFVVIVKELIDKEAAAEN